MLWIDIKFFSCAYFPSSFFSNNIDKLGKMSGTGQIRNTTVFEFTPFLVNIYFRTSLENDYYGN